MTDKQLQRTKEDIDLHLEAIDRLLADLANAGHDDQVVLLLEAIIGHFNQARPDFLMLKITK